MKSIFNTGGKTGSEYHPQKEIKYTCAITAGAIKDIFADCCDFEMRTIAIGGRRIEAELCYIDGLVSGENVGEDVIRPLTEGERFASALSEMQAAEMMMKGAVYGYTAKKRTETDALVNDILNGYCAVIFPKERMAITFETKSGDKRSISEPKEEKVVKGAKDAFIEQIRTNTMLVRRKLRDPDLKIKKQTIGRDSGTQVSVVYISGLTDTKLVTEMEKRLNAIDIDGVLASGNIEEYISDNPKSPFPQLLRTERPDRFAMNLLEGRVGLLIDGLPLGFLAPGTLAQFMKVPEDSASHFTMASALTILRYIALIFSLLLPAIYVAIAMYHQEMIPTKLMQSIIDSKQSVPFPTWAEALAMLAAFDLLQEAGLRLPSTVGETVSIIGALIVGQSAVEAKVVSPVMVIIIAFAGIAGYTIPNQDLAAAVRLCRFMLVIAAILGGMFGVAAGMVILIYHLCSIDSFGVSYMAPFSGDGGGEIARAVLRLPIRRVKQRESELNPGRIRNQR